jgi:ABC-type bacteriocin/lantibiotic exporter with double-glycine peptidase domain
MNQTFKYIKESLTTSYSKDKSLKVKLASLKILFPYLKVHWKKGFIASVFTIIVSLLALPTPYLMKYIVDDVIIAKNIKVLNLLIFLLIVVQLGKLIVSFFTNYLFDIFNKEILVEIKKKLFHCLLKLSLSFFDKNQTGYLLSRLNEVEGLSFFFSSILVRVLISFFEFIFCIGLLFYLSWKLTLISLSILPLYYFATKYYSLGIRKLSREEMEKNANLSRQVQDSLSGVEVIKVFVAEERETERINFYLDELKKVSIKNDIILAFSSELISLVGIVGGLIVLWFSSFEIIRENFTIGSYIAFSAYLAKLYGPTQISATIRLQYQRAITAL